MKYLYLIVAGLFLYANSFAQKTSIYLTVTGKKQEPLVNAGLILQNRSDSSVIEKKQTGADGKAVFAVEPNKQYILEISSVGYVPLIKIITVVNTNVYLKLEPEQKIIKKNTVNIVSKKPLITQEDDKTIVDPENLVQSSTNAFEVLEKIPGIFIDQDGNIYLSSTTPATVQINGRDMRLGAEDMATLIKSLPPNSIQKIEIIRTPSAKNDATGSGGVVNVVLKKGVKLGLTGSAYAGGNQGKYGNQFIGSSFSNNTDKKSVYASAGISRRNNYDALNTNRIFTVDSMLKQHSFNKTAAWNPYVNIGGSYMPNKKWDLGYDANFSFNQNKNRSVNDNDILKISPGTIFTSNNNIVANMGNNMNLFQNVNAKFKTDSNRVEWTSSVSYSYFKNSNEQDYHTTVTIPVNNYSFGNGNQNSSRNLAVLQTDLIWKPIKKLTLETGVKSAVLNYENKAVFTKNNTNDVYRTNRFTYSETISAAYLQASKTLGKFVMKSGLRMENTHMKGTQIIPTPRSFTINRTDFFPYVYLSRPIVTIMKYDLKGYLVYRKSIARPGYDLLNPFSRFVDNYLTEVGNPNLKPQFTETYEANISFEDQPVFAIGQNRTKGIFTNVVYQNPNNPSEALRTYDNLGNNTENYLRFTAALPPGGKYFFVVGGQRNFQKYDGLYEGKPLNFTNTSWNFFTYHQLRLDKRSTFTLNAWMQTGGLYQFYQLTNFGQVNISVNRQFLKKKLTVTLNMRDLFLTNQNTFTIKQGTVNANGNRVSDTRRFGVNLRYNFGIRKKEEQPANFQEGN